MSWTTWIIIIAIMQFIHFLGTWRLYQLAGRKAWESIIPFYSIMVWLKILQRPAGWFFIPFIPIIGPIMMGILWFDTPKSFGKATKFSLLAVITLGFYLFYLNYIEVPSYQKIEKNKRKETFISALLYAVVLATFIHTFMIQPFIIPTGSMEKTLLVGDGLFVNKWTYGYRIPLSPIGIPFMHNYIPYTGEKRQDSNGAIVWIKRPIKNYISSIRLPYFRIGQFKKVKTNDIVVFNYPTDSLNTAIDRKDPYVKRCIGTPGKTLKIENGIVYLDNKKLEYPKDARICSSYQVETTSPFSQEYLMNTPYLVTDPANINQMGKNLYSFLSLTKEEAEKLKKLPLVKQVKETIYPLNIREQGDPRGESFDIFPTNSDWNRDNYGPLKIPQKGDVVNINFKTINTYKNIIENYEHNQLKIDHNEHKIYINGKLSDRYTIKKDYYFMMGDNRHNSLDSRYFGFVPFDHIIGSPFLIWLSLDWKKGGLSFRTDRMMTIPNNGNANKQSFLWVIVVFILGYFLYSFWNKRRKKKVEEVK